VVTLGPIFPYTPPLKYLGSHKLLICSLILPLFMFLKRLGHYKLLNKLSEIPLKICILVYYFILGSVIFWSRFPNPWAGQTWWLTPVTPATWEVDIRRIVVQG
jgi:hypothetical protein